MKMIYCVLACIMLTVSLHEAMADSPEPIEYVLLPDFEVVPRSEFAGELERDVEVRGSGGRSDRWMTGVGQASLTLFLPEGEPSAAVVICPGGGYGGLSFDKEGTWVAKWLTARGAAAGVLKYSTSRGELLQQQPLREAQYAVQFMKHKVGGRVGILGFSAGGHLAATAANIPTDAQEAAGNPIALHDSRVAFAALIYPVISLEVGVTHGGSRTNLLGPAPADDEWRSLSAERLVTSDSPTAFLVSTADDRAVPAENSIRYFQACQAAGVPVELHVYPSGGHGYGMWSDTGTVAQWPIALEAWLKTQGALK